MVNTKMAFLLRMMTSFYLYISLVNLAVDAVIHDSNLTDNVRVLNSVVQKSGNQSEAKVPRMWISQLLAEVESKFEMESVNEKCQRDYQTYKAHVYDNQSVWAIRMLESSEWPSVGILAGVTHHLGHWLECLKVDANGLKGQYCVVESVLKFELEEFDQHPSTENSDQISHDCSSWEFMKRSMSDNVLTPRNNINWAMCIPSSCSSTDLQTSLATALAPIFERNNLSISVKVDPENCQIKEKPFEPSTAYTYTKNLFFVLISYVIVVTAIDVLLWGNGDDESHNHGWPVIIVRSFSLQRTLKDLFNCSNFDDRSIIPITKLIMIYLVITAHTMIHTPRFPIFQTEEMETDSLNFRLHYLDIVFGLSGFLMYEHCFKPMQKLGIRFLFIYIICRYLRILSLLMLVLPFITNMFLHTGEGPYWQSLSKVDFEPCQTVWWRNLLFINNIPHSSGRCYVTSWHFAADFQISILASFLLLLYTKNRKYGIFAFVATILLSTIAAGFAAYSTQFTGFYDISFRMLKGTIWKNVDKLNFYMATYPRINSYLPGMATSMVIQTLKKKNYKFTPLQAGSIILIAFSIILTIEFYGVYAYNKSRLSLIDLVFAGSHKFFYISSAGSLFCIFAVGITTKRVDQKYDNEHRTNPKRSTCSAFKKLLSGIVQVCQSMITWKGLVPLSKLTFGATLVSNAYQQYRLFSHPSNFTLTSTLDYLILSFSDNLFSFSIALVLYLIWESPLMLILKILRQHMIRTSMERKDD